ncbi:uncharacterized protein SRS1_10429 [Sporisorium reilianum f. sp. reilianum]|uniref:Uncharacterized protein n=1 Tax=Sporisorium reilianum f. sp. reilianum TaxID=72559 RepID=A0A2N8U8J1_9BASI|nr:uncharacterized protein SRS1_10429 [Sporisorium reilianum f. sp. reilianum]
MRTSFSILLSILSLASSSVLALPASNTPHPYPGTQPGCGPQGCHNPTGTFGLVRSNRTYHQLCNQHSHTAQHDHRAKACFDTQLKLEKVLSAPSPRKLTGYIDGSDTNFVLFAGQIVTLDEQLELHVDEAKGENAKKHGCARVRIYHLPEWGTQLDEVWCAGHNEPIQL